MKVYFCLWDFQMWKIYYSNSIKTNTVDFSPQANYTDWANVAGRRMLVPTFAHGGVSRGQRGGSLRLLISILYIGAAFK
jgi:hypothetical protein